MAAGPVSAVSLRVLGAGSCGFHGQPLSGAGASIEKTIENLGGDPQHPFVIFPEVKERGWESLDVILFSGDAYVDHPSFGPEHIL